MKLKCLQNSYILSVFGYKWTSKRPFKNDVTGVGGVGCPKLLTKSDIGEKGVHANIEITTKKICILFHVYILACFCSVRRQLSFS